MVVLLKNVPVGCKDAFLFNPPLRFHTLKCFTFEDNPTQPYNDNLCLFRSLAFHSYENKKNRELKHPKLSSRSSKEGMDSALLSCKESIWNYNLVFEDFLQLSTFLYELEIVDGKNVSKLARRSLEKHESTVRLLQDVILLGFSVSFVPKNPFIKRTNTVMLRALLICYAKVQKTVFTFPFSLSICFQSFEQRLSFQENQTNNLQTGFWIETLYESSVFESRFSQRSRFQNWETTTRFILKWKLSTRQVLNIRKNKLSRTWRKLSQFLFTTSKETSARRIEIEGRTSVDSLHSKDGKP